MNKISKILILGGGQAAAYAAKEIRSIDIKSDLTIISEEKLQKNKFLVGGEITLGQFLMILRRKIGVLKQSDAVFLFVNNSLPPSSMYLSSIYANQKDIDTNMLFITVSKENTFG